MARLNRGRVKKVGLAPGSAVYTGPDRDAQVRISVLDFRDEHFEERSDVPPGECARYRGASSVSWIDVDGVHDAGLVQSLCESFGVHPLAIEDILSIGTRPKCEEYDGNFLVVLNSLEPAPAASGSRRVNIEQISLVIGPGFVLTFQQRPGDCWEPVRKRIRGAGSRFRKSGSDYLGYALIDAIVDHYFVVLEALGDDLEAMEEEALHARDPALIRRIHTLKRDLLSVRRCLWPLREVTGVLMRSENASLVHTSTHPFLRDVHDHVVQAIETVEIYRESAVTLLEIYLAGTSNRLNQVMKVLTVIATIFIPVTFISSVYGMNFDYMPELHWRYGYFAALGLMLAVGVAMLGYFRRQNWM